MIKALNIGPKKIIVWLLIKLKGFIISKKNIEGILENICGEGKQFKMPNNFDYQGARKLLKNELQTLDVNDIVNSMDVKMDKNIKNDDIDFILSYTK